MVWNMLRNSSVSNDSEWCLYALKWVKSLNTGDIWILEASKSFTLGFVRGLLRSQLFGSSLTTGTQGVLLLRSRSQRL